MKIGCITFHNSSNYGSALQSYALQNTLEQLGCEYEILDYSNKEKHKFDSLFGRNVEMNLKSYTYKLLSFPYNYYKKKKFARFSNEYLKLTRFLKNSEDIRNIENEYDYFLCGSDQVWNSTMIRFDPTYFLSFVNNTEKKISYAASFGRGEVTDEDFRFYQDNLKNFNKISVREESAKVIVDKCSGKNAQVVLDPTLLFTAEKWRDVAKIERIPNKPYILTYRLSTNPEMQSFILKLKKQTGLQVIGISRGIVPMFKESSFAIPSPLEFVQLFANASYIVTNSFHGTAFSTNLNKNFYSFIKGDRNFSTNSRIVDFLEGVGLEKRIMTKCPVDEIDLSLPDFNQTNQILNDKREKSIAFLKQSLNL